MRDKSRSGLLGLRGTLSVSVRPGYGSSGWSAASSRYGQDGTPIIGSHAGEGMTVLAGVVVRTQRENRAIQKWQGNTRMDLVPRILVVPSSEAATAPSHIAPDA